MYMGGRRAAATTRINPHCHGYENWKRETGYFKSSDDKNEESIDPENPSAIFK